MSSETAVLAKKKAVTSQSGSTIPGESTVRISQEDGTFHAWWPVKCKGAQCWSFSESSVATKLTKHTSFYLFLAASSSQEQYRVRSADCDMYNVLFQAWHHRITIVFKALHRRPDALTCVDIEARVPSMMETCHPGEAMSFYARRPQGKATHMPHCRTMSDYVGLCRTLSDYVGLCHVGLLGSRSSKEKIQKWSNLDWKWMLENVDDIWLYE